MFERVQINRPAPPPTPNYWQGPMPTPKEPYSSKFPARKRKPDSVLASEAAASIPVQTKPPAPSSPKREQTTRSRPFCIRKLTTRQQSILDFIIRSVREKGFPPTIREIGEEVGLRSSSTVFAHLVTLEKKKYIQRDPSKPRHIKLLDGDARVDETARLRCLLEKLVEHLDNPVASRSILQEALGPDHPAFMRVGGPRQ